MKQRSEPTRKDRATAQHWEAAGLPLSLALYGMIHCIMGRLVRDKALPALDPIGSLNYFTPVIESIRQKTESRWRDPASVWALMLARALVHLGDYGWQDPGMNWPAPPDPQLAAEQKRWRKKIEARAIRWGCSLATAEARMIERARARKPRQLLIPRRARRARQKSRIEGRLFPTG